MHKETDDFIIKYFGTDHNILDFFITNNVDKYIMERIIFYNTNKKDIKLNYVQYQFTLKNEIIKKYKSFFDDLLKK